MIKPGEPSSFEYIPHLATPRGTLTSPDPNPFGLATLMDKVEHYILSTSQKRTVG